MSHHRIPARCLAVALSVSLVGLGAPRAQAADHIAGPDLVARRLLESAKTREAKLRLFGDALATEAAQKQARSLGLDPERLRRAVPHLTDAELADLEARALRVKDVRAGHGMDGVALLGILLLVAGLIVLVAVADDGYYDDYCYCY